MEKLLHYLNVFYSTLLNAYSRLKSTSHGKAITNMLRLSVTFAVLAFLIYQLNKIGFKNIIQSLPSSNWFYCLFFIRYFTLPLSEVIIYGFSITFKFTEALKVFIMKKILNADLIAFSGEAYLLAACKTKWKLKNKATLHLIKDNNLISSFVSLTTAVAVLAILFYYKQIDFVKNIGLQKNVLFIALLIFISIVIVFFILRKTIFRHTFKTGFKIYAINQIRLLCSYSLEILMCIVALPDIPMNIWFTLLAVQIVYSKIPFLPSQELILLGLYAKIVEMYQVPQAQIMAVYLTMAALNKVFSLGFYILFNFGSKKNFKPKTN